MHVWSTFGCGTTGKSTLVIEESAVSCRGAGTREKCSRERKGVVFFTRNINVSELTRAIINSCF
jgi:hypothetical protein